jgi:hypothetical protein
VLLILLDAFRVHALHDPGTIIMTSAAGDALTYREAWNVSELVGAHLIERKERGELAPDAQVAVVGSTHPLLLSCCFAATKGGCGYRLFNDRYRKGAEGAASLLASIAASGIALILTASETLTPELLRSESVDVLDAHRIRTYIVPGMTDDFSCGCGAEDCAHGPFLQECSPADWLGDEAFFAFEEEGGGGLRAYEHDALLAEALEAAGDERVFSTPFNLADPWVAATVALGGELRTG